MPRSRIIPKDSALKAMEVLAPDGATALHIIALAHCAAARVERHRQHAFDTRLDENGVWTIFPAVSPDKESSAQTA